jgi:hypothetical protein
VIEALSFKSEGPGLNPNEPIDFFNLRKLSSRTLLRGLLSL